MRLFFFSSEWPRAAPVALVVTVEGISCSACREKRSRRKHISSSFCVKPYVRAVRYAKTLLPTIEEAFSCEYVWHLNGGAEGNKKGRHGTVVSFRRKAINYGLKWPAKKEVGVVVVVRLEGRGR